MTTKLNKDAVDPRVRMKKVRSEVAMYVGSKKSNPAGLSHLGELPKNMPDARRVIIALQDLLEDSNVRHKKASDHIRDLKFNHQCLLDGFNALLAFSENRSRDICEKAKLQTESVVILANQVSNLEEQLSAKTKERDTWRATASLVIKEGE